MRTRSILLASISLAVLSALAACTSAPAGSVTEKVEVPAPAERSADVKLTMDSGDVRLAGAAAALVEGSVTYPAQDGKPRVIAGSRESTAGKVATVDVEQGKVAPGTLGRRLLDLRLNGGLPMDLEVVERNGDADLDLTLVDPKDLAVESVSGDSSIKLSGPHPSLSSASFVTKSGETSIKADGEYPALESFKVDAASGNVSLDLSGTWNKEFTARLTAASGNVTLTLPRNVNVRVVGAPASGSVTAEGFTRAAGAWTRASEKPSEFTLTVEVGVASGNLTLLLPEKK